MSKIEFLAKLKKGLKGLSQDDIEEHVSFYNEMIDDRVEEGLSEEEAVSQIGSIDDVIEQILSETRITKIIREKVKPKRSLSAWEIVLLVLGSPIWLSLLIALFAVIFSFFVAVGAVIIAFNAIVLAFAVCAFFGIIYFFVFALRGELISGIALLGVGISCLGLTIISLFTCKDSTVGIMLLFKRMINGIKHLFVGRGKDNE